MSTDSVYIVQFSLGDTQRQWWWMHDYVRTDEYASSILDDTLCWNKQIIKSFLTFFLCYCILLCFIKCAVSTCDRISTAVNIRHQNLPNWDGRKYQFNSTSFIQHIEIRLESQKYKLSSVNKEIGSKIQILIGTADLCGEENSRRFQDFVKNLCITNLLYLALLSIALLLRLYAVCYIYCIMLCNVM